MKGKQIRLYLVDGTAGGLMTAEIVNWTGHLLMGKREKLAEIRQRKEASRTGVYILLGDDEVTGQRTAYIGQSDDVGKRLTQHDANKTFWDEVVLVTSKDANLTSAHVRYLESQLIRLANAIGRTPLTNGNLPSGGAELPEADASDMDYFLVQVRILLPVLGIDMLRGRARNQPAGQSSPPLSPNPADSTTEPSPVFSLSNRAGVDARAQVVDGEFTLLEGSVIRARMHDSTSGSESTRRQYVSRAQLHAQAIAGLEPNPGGETVTTQRDIVFSSPSAAAAVVQGHATSNGRTAWVTATGETYGAWEASGTG